MALGSPISHLLGELVPFFMGIDLVHHQPKGAHINDLGSRPLLFIVINYLNKVVGTAGWK